MAADGPQLSEDSVPDWHQHLLRRSCRRVCKLSIQELSPQSSFSESGEIVLSPIRKSSSPQFKKTASKSRKSPKPKTSAAWRGPHTKRAVRDGSDSVTDDELLVTPYGPGSTFDLGHNASQDSGYGSSQISPLFNTLEKPPSDSVEQAQDGTVYPEGVPLEECADVHITDCADVWGPEYRDYFEEPVLFSVQLPNVIERYTATVSIDNDEKHGPVQETERLLQMLHHVFPRSGRNQLAQLSAEVEKSLTIHDSRGFLVAIDNLNKLVRQQRSHMRLPQPASALFIHELLNMTYLRVVSPAALKLRQYKSFSNEVYGELLPSFVSKIFAETNLQKDQVFVDLGSGVGNCVLQAALEIGCESWGCELMPLPSQLANAQQTELENRARAWGLPCGSIHLLAEDFVTSKAIHGTVAKANVVLANNFMFDARLNSHLLNLFLDLPEGAKIVSLRPFVSPRHTISLSNYESAVSILRTEVNHFGPDSVNWTHTGGTYYITTVDRQPLRNFMTKYGLV